MECELREGRAAAAAPAKFCTAPLIHAFAGRWVTRVATYGLGVLAIYRRRIRTSQRNRARDGQITDRDQKHQSPAEQVHSHRRRYVGCCLLENEPPTGKYYRGARAVRWWRRIPASGSSRDTRGKHLHEVIHDEAAFEKFEACETNVALRMTIKARAVSPFDPRLPDV